MDRKMVCVRFLRGTGNPEKVVIYWLSETIGLTYRFEGGYRQMRVLFVGNSHTYFNDMPCLFAEICRYNRVETDVVMLAHGGKGLDFHRKEPEVRFNIRYGGYDAIILQHTAHPMGDLEEMRQAAGQLAEWAVSAGSLPVFYMTWTAKRDGASRQSPMSRAYRRLGEENSCPVAPVGEVWWRFHQLAEKEELYAPDGEHASPLGSLLAAHTIATTVTGALGLSAGLDLPAGLFPKAASSEARPLLCRAAAEILSQTPAPDWDGRAVR